MILFNHPSQMEPLSPRENKGLINLVMKVYAHSSELAGMAQPFIRKDVSRLIRNINSYYSLRMEGEHATPFEIEQAVKGEYSQNEEKKKLQLLSLAHIEVLKLIDELLNSDPDFDVCSTEFICWIHKELYQRAPESFLKINPSNRKGHIVMNAGELRKENVDMENHIAPTWKSVTDFLGYFEKKYSLNDYVGHNKIIVAAASHHRLAWIHPFLGGNGPITRLFTYAFMRKIGIESHGLWSISRGLALNADTYKNMLSIAESPNRRDFDGKGNLSEKALLEFCEFFFETAAEQILFMKKILSLDTLHKRIESYVHRRTDQTIPDEKILRVEAKYVLTEIMMRGEIARGEVPRLIGLGERTASSLISQLLEEGLVLSDSHRSPLRFHVPAKVIGYYFPDLYPIASV